METKKLCVACISFIEENLTKEITLNDIVKAVYFSRSYLQHSFKKEMGVSIVQYLRSRKMEIAKELLDLGKTPSAVAKELGFENNHQFGKRFKYYYGVSPRGYQNRK